MSGRWLVTPMCEALEVSASAYLHWSAAKRSAQGPRHGVSDEAVLAQINAIHVQIGAEYGWPRMH